MKKSKLRTAFTVFMILFGNFWLYTKIFWPSTFVDAPEILANLYAKEVCTCHFMIGFSPERCVQEHFVLKGPSSYSVDETKGTVRVRVLWAFSEARKVSDRFGCVRTDVY